jgi:hypothetical protein
MTKLQQEAGGAAAAGGGGGGGGGGGSVAAQLRDSVVRNAQLELSNVHIRYEDPTLGSSAFAMGVTLRRFSTAEASSSTAALGDDDTSPPLLGAGAVAGLMYRNALLEDLGDRHLDEDTCARRILQRAALEVIDGLHHRLAHGEVPIAATARVGAHERRHHQVLDAGRLDATAFGVCSSRFSSVALRDRFAPLPGGQSEADDEGGRHGGGADGQRSVPAHELAQAVRA